MEVKEETKPFWSVDKYLHFVVLGLSCLNLAQRFPAFGNSLTLANSFSILLSLAGILSFWLIHKNRSGGAFLIILWCIPQLVVFTNSPYYIIDLTQGYSLAAGITFESSSNHLVNREVSLYFNIIASILLSASFFRLRNRRFYQALEILPLNIEGLNKFTSQIIKTYQFGTDKKMQILSYNVGSKSYVIQTENSETFNFTNENKEYLLCDIDTTATKLETFKPYEFRELGKVKIRISTSMQPEIKDKILIDLFIQNDGLLLEINTTSGKKYKVWNIAWGYDIGDEYAHVTSNISPGIEGFPIDFFFTNEIIDILSVDQNRIIYKSELNNDENSK